MHFYIVGTLVLGACLLGIPKPDSLGFATKVATKNATKGSDVEDDLLDGVAVGWVDEDEINV